MVRSMLELSRLQAKVEEMQGASVVAMESFDITELLSLALVSNEHRIEEKGLDVDADFGSRAVMTMGIKEGISLVVYNLVDNAIKFAVPYSTLSLSVKVSGQKAHVSVKNCGPTIPPEEQSAYSSASTRETSPEAWMPAARGWGFYIVKTVTGRP
jgi:signal transduction histidine kinase